MTDTRSQVTRQLAQFLARALDTSTKHARPWRDLLDEYVGEMAARRSSRYVAETRRTLARVLTWLGVDTLDDLDPQPVERYARARLGEGKSVRTVLKETTALRTFVRWAIQAGELSSDPLERLRAIQPTEADRTYERRPLTDAECARLIRAADELDRLLGVKRPRVPQAPWLCFLLSTGARWGEAASLTWADVDLSERVARFRAARTKTRRERLIPLRTDVARRLAALRSAVAPVLGRPASESTAVFLSPQGRPQRPNGSMRLLRRVTTAAGIAAIDAAGQRVDYHSLRYTAATQLQRAGAPVTMAQRLLGHSRSETTSRIYTRFDLSDLRRAVEAVPSVGTGDRTRFRHPSSSPNRLPMARGVGGGTRNRTGGDGFATDHPCLELTLPEGSALETLTAALADIADAVEAGRVVVLLPEVER